MDEWRKPLMQAAFAAAIGWMTLLRWLEAKGRTSGRRARLAPPLLALLAVIAILVYGPK